MREFVIYQNDNGDWIAECNELPGYRVKAGTKEEVINKLKTLLLTYYPCRCED